MESCLFRQTKPNHHKKIVVEAKSVYPSEDMPKFPCYKLPVRHVPQCLCELVAYSADELWLINFTLYSVTLIEVYFDPILWEKLLSLAKEKYDMARPVMPLRLHTQSKKLRAELVHFVETHIRFVLEVPSLCGEMVFNIPDMYISPYQAANCFKESNLDLSCLDHSAHIISEESTLVFRRIHEVLHVQATELGMLMICCKDQLQTGGVPNSLPL